MLTLLYARTAPRDLTSFADSCEFVTASELLIPAHPPGFPLSVVLGKVLTAPLHAIESVYLRHVVVTVALGTATAWLTMRTTLLLTESVFAAAFAGVLFGLMRETWTYAVVPEVFALNSFLASLAIFLLVRGSRTHDERDLHLAWGIAGLGAGSHWTLLLLLPSAALVSASVTRSLRGWLRHLAALTLGGASIALLPWLASRPPLLLFPVEASSAAILHHGLRRQYGGIPFACTFDALLFFLNSIREQLSPLVALPFYAGILAARRRRDVAAHALTLGFILTGPLFMVAMGLENDSVESHGMMERFHVLPFTMLTPLLALGAHALLAPYRHACRAWIGVAALAGTFLVVKNLPRCDRHEDRTTRALVTAMMDGVADESFVVGHGDAETFALYYAYYVENPQRHVTVLNDVLLPLLENHPSALRRYASARPAAPLPSPPFEDGFYTSKASVFVTDAVVRTLGPDVPVHPTKGIVFRVGSAAPQPLARDEASLGRFVLPCDPHAPPFDRVMTDSLASAVERRCTLLDGVSCSRPESLCKPNRGSFDAGASH